MNLVMRLLKSLHLKLPQQSSIVIFDASGSDTLERFSLGGRHRFEIVYSRFEHICAHPKIVFRTFLRYLSILYSYCFYNGQLRRSDILTAYYWAMLDQIRPKVVITFIDTVSPFYRLSRIVKGVTFIAVQNGNRGEDDSEVALNSYTDLVEMFLFVKKNLRWILVLQRVNQPRTSR